jgi:hypothetical protein
MATMSVCRQGWGLPPSIWAPSAGRMALIGNLSKGLQL